MTVQVIEWLQSTRLSHTIAHADHLLMAALQIVHVFGFILLLAPLLLIGIRVVAGALSEEPLDSILKPSLRLSALGLALSLASGSLMFLSAPSHYYANRAFDLKMLVLVLSLLISSAFVVTARQGGPRLRLVAKIGISLSVVSWIVVCMAGRAIGFV